MTKNQWNLLVNNQEVVLQLIKSDKKSGTCWNCQEYKEICLISERKINLDNWERRKFCEPCSLNNLQQLEEAEIANKSEIIKELRNKLNNYE